MKLSDLASKGLPITILVLLAIWCFNTLNPGMVCFPEPIFHRLAKAIIVTSIIGGICMLTLLKKAVGYQLMKWLLVVSVIIAGSIMLSYSSRLFDYGYSTLINGEYQEIQLSPKERWTDIYLPILRSFGVTSIFALMIWVWTRESIRKNFVKLPPTGVQIKAG